jgi:membrane-associated phospholipid phosphatase
MANQSGLVVATARPVSSFVSRYAWWLLAAHGVAASLLYSFAAHHPIREPWIVPASRLDAVIPMIPWSAWVYASYLFLLPTLVLFGRHRPGFARVFVTGVSCALLNASIYILFPTSLAERTVAPAGTLMAVIQSLDTTLCALPSGHVALPTSLMVAAALLTTEGPHLARIWTPWTNRLALWTLLLAASTLFTKQHYLIDVAAGAVYGGGLAAAAAWLVTSRDRERWRSAVAPGRRLDEAA